MIIPTYFIIPPAILALLLYLVLYYKRNPDNRLTDLRFLLAFCCFLVVAGQMFVIVQSYQGTVPSVALCLAALGLLGTAVWMLLDRPTVIAGGR
jgi:hypothetical protein